MLNGNYRMRRRNGWLTVRDSYGFVIGTFIDVGGGRDMINAVIEKIGRDGGTITDYYTNEPVRKFE